MSEPEPESELGEETPKETHIPNSQSNSPIPQLDPNSPIPITKGPKGFTITCHICGQIFTKETRQKAFNSLNTHCIRKKDGEHGHQLNPIDYGLPPPTPPQAKGKKTKKTGVVQIKTVEVELPELEEDYVEDLATERTVLEEESRTEAARGVRDRYRQRRAEQAREYGTSQSGHRERMDRQELIKLGKLEAQVEQYKEEEETVGAQQETIDELMEKIDDKDKLLFEQMRSQNETIRLEKDRAHEKEMELIKQMFESQKENDRRYHETQMVHMKEMIAQRDQTKTWEQLAAQTISSGLNKIGDTGSKLLGILMEEDARPPVRERGGPSNIADMVAEQAPHMVVDFNEFSTQSRGVQNIEVPDVGVQVKHRRFSGSVVNDKDVGAPAEPNKEVEEK